MGAFHIMANDYMAHGYCFLWETPLVYLHVISDIVTGLAYYSIPAALLYFIYRRRDVPFVRLLTMFAVFILACGTTHFFAAYTIFNPIYWLEGYVKAFTAIVSVLTAALLIPRLPEAIALPSLSNTLASVKALNQELISKNMELDVANFCIEKALDPVYWISSDGSIWKANEAACKALGYTSAEMLDLSLFDIEPNLRPERWSELWEELKIAGSAKFEAQHRTKGGHLLDVEISTNYFSFPGREFHCAMVRDITERKQAGEALRESEGQFRTIVEGSPDAIFVGVQERFAFVNAAGIKLFGAASADELLGQPVLDRIHPDHIVDVRERIRLLMVEKKRVSTVERRYLKLDGTPIDVESSAVPFTYKNQNSTLTFIRDISERKQAEQERETLQARLNQAQKIESVGRLAGGVAHDFNNMLAVILGHSEMAMNQMDPTQPQYEDLQEIRKAAERSADLTRQLLTFARKQTVAPKVLDLNETVEGMLKMLRRLIGEDIGLAWLPGRSPSSIKIDPTQIDQILANLCVNARDAIAGGGKITIETGSVSFDEAYCARRPGCVPGEYVLLAISDDGAGMDKETLSQIFEPFFTTKGMGKGTGLGLATVYGIINQNNGFVDVYSEPGQGTTFKIFFPLTTDKVPQIPKEGSAERGRETILLVEDESAVLALVERTLKSLGYTVLAAATSGEAIRLAEAHAEEINLLITDVVMPGMNGQDLAQHLRSLYPNLKCLFMSGYPADIIARHGILDKDKYFLQKPFTMHTLAKKIRETLE